MLCTNEHSIKLLSKTHCTVMLVCIDTSEPVGYRKIERCSLEVTLDEIKARTGVSPSRNCRIEETARRLKNWCDTIFGVERVKLESVITTEKIEAWDHLFIRKTARERFITVPVFTFTNRAEITMFMLKHQCGN